MLSALKPATRDNYKHGCKRERERENLYVSIWLAFNNSGGRITFKLTIKDFPDCVEGADARDKN